MVTRIPHARMLAVAVYLSEYLEAKEKEIILEKWEKITFHLWYALYGDKDSRRRLCSSIL